MKIRKPVLIVVIGIPGSGKTFYTERIAKKCDFVHLNSDAFRLGLLSKPKYTHTESIRVFSVIDFLTRELLSQGKSIIYDANVLKVSYRTRLRALAKRSGASFLLLYINTPLSLALKRAAKRHIRKTGRQKLLYRPIPETIAHGYAKRFELPTREPHVMIDGTTSFSQEWPKIAQAMRVKR